MSKERMYWCREAVGDRFYVGCAKRPAEAAAAFREQFATTGKVEVSDKGNRLLGVLGADGGWTNLSVENSTDDASEERASAEQGEGNWLYRCRFSSKTDPSQEQAQPNTWVISHGVRLVSINSHEVELHVWHYEDRWDVVRLERDDVDKMIGALNQIRPTMTTEPVPF
jgi:hypothetical protein